MLHTELLDSPPSELGFRWRTFPARPGQPGRDSADGCRGRSRAVRQMHRDDRPVITARDAHDGRPSRPRRACPRARGRSSAAARGGGARRPGPGEALADGVGGVGVAAVEQRRAAPGGRAWR